MPICSNWKITWDAAGSPIVYLDFAQEIADEFQLPLEQAHRERKVINGTHTDYLPDGHVTGVLEVTIYKEQASDAAARNYYLAQLAAAPWGVRKTITIQVLDGDSYTLAGCMIKKLTPVIQRDPDKARTGITYRWLCGALAIVP